LALATLCLAATAAQAQTPPIPSYIRGAVANPARPAADRADDNLRKPAESLAFAGIKPGDTVVDMLPGRGYFTNLFCTAVGRHGHVYQLTFTNMKMPAPSNGMARKPPPPAPPPVCANITKLAEPDTEIKIPEKVDLIWTSRNYHDLHNTMFGKPNMLTFDQQIYAALKPGGIFLVLDHAAAAGTGATVTETLHRIDPATVKQEVTAAGFVFDGQSDVLSNPADDHTKPSFALHNTTDQFIYKFRKPQ